MALVQVREPQQGYARNGSQKVCEVIGSSSEGKIMTCEASRRMRPRKNRTAVCIDTRGAFWGRYPSVPATRRLLPR